MLMDKKHCEGCYNNIYNNGAGGAKQCFSLATAEVIMRKEVHIDQVPPWNQKAKRFPDCYSRQRYAYVSPDRKC